MSGRDYRVWHEANGRYAEGELMLAQDGRVYEVCRDSLEGKFDVHLYPLTGEYTVERSTKLRDKNLRDVYAGDIVHVQLIDGTYDALPVVFEAGCYFVINEKGRFILGSLSSFEVIGNIHEVLNGKKHEV